MVGVRKGNYRVQLSLRIIVFNHYPQSTNIRFSYIKIAHPSPLQMTLNLLVFFPKKWPRINDWYNLTLNYLWYQLTSASQSAAIFIVRKNFRLDCHNWDMVNVSKLHKSSRHSCRGTFRHVEASSQCFIAILLSFRVHEYFIWALKVVNGLRGTNQNLEAMLDDLFTKRGLTCDWLPLYLTAWELILQCTLRVQFETL